MQARKPTASASNVNLLVINYDQTAFTLEGTRRDMLSYSLINFAHTMQTGVNVAASTSTTSPLTTKNQSFDAFYGFSQRCVDLMYMLRNNLRKKLDRLHKEHKASSYEKECLDDNFLTYKITENLEEATNLKCRAVSTPDDLPGNKPLGTSYNEMLKPWEETKLDFKKMPDEHITLKALSIKYPENRQYRLTEIAKDAAKAYPDRTVTLAFVNDKEKQCEEALKVPNSTKYGSHWPANVNLDVYHHHATSNEAPVRYVGTTLKASNLRSHGLFAAPTHTMATRTQKRALEAPQPDQSEQQAAAGLMKFRRTG